MKRARGGKSFHLNKTIYGIVAIIYTAMLILLLSLDWYLIQIRHDQIINQEKAALDKCIEEIHSSQLRIESYLSKMFAYDSNFNILQLNQSDYITEYNAVYALNYDMVNNMNLDDSFCGYVFFYENGTKSRHQVYEPRIESDKARLINDQLCNSYKSQSYRKWNINKAEDTIYLSVIYSKGAAGLSGIYSLDDINLNISESVESPVNVMILDTNTVYTEQDDETKEYISELIADRENTVDTSEGKYYTYGKRIPNTDIWICALYENKYISAISWWQWLVIILTVFAIISAFYLYTFMYKEMFDPLRTLTLQMDKIRKGDEWEPIDEDFMFVEMQDINNTLEQMVRALEEQKILTYEEAAQKNKVQLQYLYLQLKPHFYLNSLKTLNAMIFENKPERAHDFIMKMSEYLRYLLNVNKEKTELSKEIQFVENYLDMQRYISSRDIKATINCEKEAEDFVVPVLIIQTFVENSIKYAKNKSYGGMLEIRINAEVLAMEDGRMLSISVVDNGDGYSPEVLAELEDEDNTGNFCVGIKNIRSRCRLLYGDSAGFSFFNDNGARSEIIIPENL